MPLAAQQSREVVCEECEQMVQMTDSTISCMGYRCAPAQAEADSMAMSNARRELIELLRDSVAAICYRAEVRNATEEYIEYQMFSDQAETRQFFFTNEGILVETPVVCRNTYQDKDGKCHSCCVLVAKREELSRGSNMVMFEILQRMFMMF